MVEAKRSQSNTANPDYIVETKVETETRLLQTLKGVQNCPDRMIPIYIVLNILLTTL